jgi:nucleotide-binding universal stress UspA family protein
MLQRILLGIDGSEGSEGAVRHALALADATDATLHVLAVVETLAGLDADPVGGQRSDADDADPDGSRSSDADDADPDNTVSDANSGAPETTPDVDWPERALADVTARAESRGVTVETTVERGVPYRRIVDHARAADLVVVGRHGTGGLRELLLGSTAERVVRRSPVPVVTPETDAAAVPAYDTLLLCLDGSDGARAAVAPTIDLARACGATVHVLSVVDTTPFDPDVVVDLLDGFETIAAEVVDGVAADLGAVGVETVTAVERGAAAATVRTYASRVDADLVAMGVTGATGLDASLLGSTTAKVLRAGERAVLTAPRPPDSPPPSV